MNLIEYSVQGRRAYELPLLDVPFADSRPDEIRRKTSARLPEVSEIDVVRHFTRLASRAFGVDSGFYPLGSCTMKYNPKLNEKLASLENFTDIHPLQPEKTVQGSLRLIYELLTCLCRITGMKWGTLQPAAGAHGEYTGLKLIRAARPGRSKILVPESAHGTNPASAAVNGFSVVSVPSDKRGLVDIDALCSLADEDTAGIMLTNPNTLGLFESDIEKIAEIVHGVGGLLYYDGANMNAIMGHARPGDMGFDVVHLNLHKTFSTPHGGGGPGSGPVLVKDELVKFLPKGDVVRNTDGTFSLSLSNNKNSVGKVTAFWGNFLVYVRAYAYILTMGSDGLEAASTAAVLNANYMMARLKDTFPVAYGGICKHEFVLSLSKLLEETGVSALDIAKALLDLGYHPPTMYFPSIVHEALMIEPTESETKETLDGFCDALIALAEKAHTDPEFLHSAPYKTVISRVDEVRAAREPVLHY